jgi:hypothetical protein
MIVTAAIAGATIRNGNSGVALKRFEHRDKHIEQIQRALGTH